MKLLVVESPSKAKTITKYLDDKYKVIASVGHIKDLPKSNKKAIDIENDFRPNYEVVKGKEAVVDNLLKECEKADEIYIATDPDREGEAIAYHVAQICHLDKPNRVAFNEITKEAVQEALKHPRVIDDNLRSAQEARRVLDRLVGYDLSGLIWKKLRYGLSAGRVQSPALRIIMEREREIRAFLPETYWVIEAGVENKKKEQFVLICTEDLKDKKLVDYVLEHGKKSSWIVSNIEEKNVKQSPRPPFITSTLQQVANSRLSFSPSRTMQAAQKLYEAGHITYMRTDSTSIARSAQAQIIKQVEKEFGAQYVEAKVFKTKSKSAQEAHEAIRPTDISKKSAGTTVEQKKLFELIRARTLASQMTKAEVVRTRIVVLVGDDKKIPPFAINGSRIVFPGWFIADPFAKSEDTILPKVERGESLKLLSLDSLEKQTQPPKRYSEAGLIKELEKREIGRPSTYASIIKTIVDRGYVEKDGRTLIPTDTGDVVNEFLEKNFQEYISDSFTAEMEEELDEIAEGKREYAKTLRDFYTPFAEKVKSKEDLPKINTLGDADEKHKCPVCGKSMIIKLGKIGKFLSCSTFPDCIGARTIEGRQLEGPKEIGEDCPKCKNGQLIEREGRFGKFISCNKYPKCKFVKESEEEAKAKKTGVTCPLCKNGEMMERRGRFGIFYSCERYPDCKFAIKSKPTGNTCTYKKADGTVCGALEMEGTKTIPNRCSDKTCPNHNPHKLEKK